MQQSSQSITTQNEAQKVTTVRLPEFLWEAASILAVKQRTSFNDVVISALREYLADSAADSSNAA